MTLRLSPIILLCGMAATGVTLLYGIDPETCGILGGSLALALSVKEGQRIRK
jgi:hypothetical protein